jgi:methanogenic corrinoid protein MtbC1
MAGSLVDALADLNEKSALALAEEKLKAGDDPLSILDEARKGMEIVGERFEKGEYYLGELVYSGDILKQISQLVKPHLQKQADEKPRGVVIMGSVAGDLHDIGKNIVCFLLEANGFKVYDLGVDIPPAKFVEKIKETGATIVGLSGLLTAAIDSMKTTVDAIRKGQVGDVKIMIGGAPTDEEAKSYTGADGWGRDALDGVAIAKEWSA